MTITAYNPTAEDKEDIKKFQDSQKHIRPPALPAAPAAPVNNGFDIQIHADGKILQESDRAITLTATPKHMLEREIPRTPSVITPSNWAAASITLNAGNELTTVQRERNGVKNPAAAIANTPAQVADIASVEIKSPIVNVHSVESVTVESGKTVYIKTPIAAPAAAQGGAQPAGGQPAAAHPGASGLANPGSEISLNVSGDASLKGTGIGTIGFDASIGLNSRELRALVDAATIAAKTGGILLGNRAANGNGIDMDKALIAVSGNLQFAADLDAKKQAFEDKDGEFRNLEGQKAGKERELSDKRDALTNATEDSQRTTIQAEITTLETEVNTLGQQLQTKKSEVDTARSQYNTAIANNKSQENLILRNAGETGQQITLTKEDITLSSKGSITIQDPNKTKGLKIDAKNGKLETIGGAMKVALNGQMVDIG